MIIGFTGTSKYDLTPAQLAALRQLFSGMLTVLHSGDCVHADAQAHALAVEMHAFTIGHPPSDDRRRAFCKYDQERTSKPFLERNHDIVDEGVDGLIAAPRTMTMVMRSGTWATVRYACRLNRTIWIVRPDGVVEVS